MFLFDRDINDCLYCFCFFSGIALLSAIFFSRLIIIAFSLAILASFFAFSCELSLAIFVAIFFSRLIIFAFSLAILASFFAFSCELSLAIFVATYASLDISLTLFCALSISYLIVVGLFSWEKVVFLSWILCYFCFL